MTKEEKTKTNHINVIYKKKHEIIFFTIDPAIK